MKDLKISKELLSEVLGYEVDVFLGITENEIDYTCCRDKNIGYEDISINIYKFAFKCKEWALKKEYVISSHSKYKLDGYNCIIYCNNGEIDEDFTSDTEIEAIIKACEWILNQEELDKKISEVE